MKNNLFGLKYNVSTTLEKRKIKGDNSEALNSKNIPILLNVTYNGKRVVINTGLKMDFDFNSPEHKKTKFTEENITSRSIRTEIGRLYLAVDKVFAPLEEYPIPEKFRELFNEKIGKKQNPVKIKDRDAMYFFEEYLKLKKPDISNWRYKQLSTVKTHFQSFISEKMGILYLIDINASIIHRFETYLKSDKKNPRSQNTVSGILVRLRSFLNFAYVRGWMDHRPFEKYKIEKEVYGDPIYLSKEELDIIFNKEIPNKKLARTRDMFCLQCNIGARIGDFIKLKHDNIIDGAIHYIPSKTAHEKAISCKIPLTKRAKSIIDKYNIPGGDLVPYITGQKYNVNLKELFKFCEITRKVARLNPQTRKTEIVNISDIASSHMARRTFIGILFKSTKNEIIASMSGHVQDSKAFQRYYTITNEDQKEAIQALEGKVKS